LRTRIRICGAKYVLSALCLRRLTRRSLQSTLKLLLKAKFFEFGGTEVSPPPIFRLLHSGLRSRFVWCCFVIALQSLLLRCSRLDNFSLCCMCSILSPNVSPPSMSCDTHSPIMLQAPVQAIISVIDEVERTIKKQPTSPRFVSNLHNACARYSLCYSQAFISLSTGMPRS